MHRLDFLLLESITREQRNNQQGNEDKQRP